MWATWLSTGRGEGTATDATLLVPAAGRNAQSVGHRRNLGHPHAVKTLRANRPVLMRANRGMAG
eukprot:6201962-Pleurochrysis_carterae.AAC.1